MKTYELIGTVIQSLSLLFILCTLLEMKKQRLSSYKPSPRFISEAIYLQLSHYKIPAIYKRQPESLVTRHIFEPTNHFDLKITNAGLGPILDLTISWELEKEKIFDQLKEYSDAFTELKFDDRNNEVAFSSESGSMKYQLFQNDEQIERQYNYIPAAIQPSSQLYSLPTTYLVYLSIKCFFDINKNSNILVNDIVPLTLVMNYFDIGLRNYKEKYNLFFHIGDYSGGLIMDSNNSATENVNFAAGDFEMRKFSKAKSKTDRIY